MPSENIQSEPVLVIADAPDVCKTYSNHINITWSAFDVRLHFGDFSAQVNPKDEKLHVETKAVVAVSWPQAKQISEILAEVIRRFEAANGEIKKVSEIKPS
jgi:hypothetical protein